MAKRLQSPSSINTFKQCQRKYFYQYIAKLPTGDSIHLVRGNIVHSALEDFYDIDASTLNRQNYKIKCTQAIQKLLLHHWGQYNDRLGKLDMSPDQLKFYFEESMVMTLNWHNHILRRLDSKLKEHPKKSFEEVFNAIAPIREEEYKSKTHHVRGFIDAIRMLPNGEVHIVDYKTNSRSEIKESIRRQLSIYAMMYEEKHGKLPEKVGAFFLRDTLKMISVTREMVEQVKFEIEQIHAHTELTEDPLDYKKNITPLCKWRTGQCDFYETCQPHNPGKEKRVNVLTNF